jgi:peptidoglycan hydrolase-like protein with peptidoglycan-binding domain
MTRYGSAIALALTLCAGPAFAHDPDRPLTQADIRHAQQTLDELGYQLGTFDGRFGPRTRTAVRNFQRDKGLNATGRLDAETLAELDRGTERMRNQVRGEMPSSGTAIRRAQERLNRLGYPVAETDGVVGPETRTAIRNFQRDKGLNATGELDDQTLEALDRDSGSATSGVGAK